MSIGTPEIGLPTARRSDLGGFGRLGKKEVAFASSGLGVEWSEMFVAGVTQTQDAVPADRPGDLPCSSPFIYFISVNRSASDFCACRSVDQRRPQGQRKARPFQRIPRNAFRPTR